MFRAALIALGTAGLISGTARAGPCGNEAAQLADSMAMSTELPQAGVDALQPAPSPPGGAQEPSPLAKSGGVIAPPDIGRTPTLTPPDVDQDMPTAPPAAAPSPTPDPSARLSPEIRQKIESLLTAAGRDDEAGRSEQCLQRLAEAKKLLGDAG